MLTINPGRRSGRVTAAGNSSSALYYSFTDNKPFAGINYYRLHLVDIDGKSAYSVTKLLNFGSTQITILPNPVYNKLYISNVPASAQIMLLSVDGRILINRETQPGSEAVDMSNFVSGFYILQLRDKTSGSLLSSFKVIKE